MHILHAKESRMNNDLNLNAQRLTRGALHKLRDGRGTLLQCLSGTLWLTQEDDLRDIVLEAGDAAPIVHDGLSIVSALSDASFLLLRRPHAD